MDRMDESLSSLVNYLSVAIFTAIVGYHVLTAQKRDA